MPSGVSTISTQLQTDIEQESSTLAMLVKLSRRDGVVMGFTSCDIDIVFGGVTYEAGAAVEATGIDRKLGAGVDSLDISGMLDSTRIKESDLRAGLYDMAGITVMVVNYSDLSHGALTMLRGTVGNVTYDDGQVGYHAEVRSVSQMLSQNICELTSKTCRVMQLGDSRCAPGGTFQNGLTMSSYRNNRTLYSVDADPIGMTFAADAAATGYYNYGVVRFTSGANSGLEREIKTHTLISGRAYLTLQEPFPFVPSPGDAARLEAGCDRTITQCRVKFANAYNFQGEPHIPTTDVIMQRGTGTS